MSRWAIVQARMGSTRLPGKVLRRLAGKPMLQRIVERSSRARLLDGVAVATSTHAADDPVAVLSREIGVPCFRGSEGDVLDRFHGCTALVGADTVVRLTGDDPFFDPAIIDSALSMFGDERVDYLRYRDGLPLGTAVEVMSRRALDRAWREALDAECREHVTPYLYRNPDRFRVRTAPREGEDLSAIRLTVDTEEDFEVAEWIYESLGGDGGFSLEEVIGLVERAGGPLANQEIAQKTVSYQGEGKE